MVTGGKVAKKEGSTHKASAYCFRAASNLGQTVTRWVAEQRSHSQNGQAVSGLRADVGSVRALSSRSLLASSIIVLRLAPVFSITQAPIKAEGFCEGHETGMVAG